jgi:hypothetical protein
MKFFAQIFKPFFMRYGWMGGFAKVDNEKWLQGGSMAFFSSLTILRFFSFFHDIIS